MKNSIALFLLLCFSYHSIGQISQTNIDNVKNYAIARVVYEYLKEASKEKNKTKNFDAIKSKLESNKISSPMTLDTLRALLEANGFKNTKLVFVDKLNDIQTDPTANPSEIANSIVKAIYDVENVALKSSAANSIREPLLKEIESNLNSGVPTKPVSGKTSSNESTQSGSTTEETKEPKSNFLSLNFNLWNHVLPIGLSLLFFIICLVKFGTVNGRIERRKNEITDLGHKSFAGNSDRDYSRLDKKIEDLRYSMSLIQSDIDFLKKQKQEKLENNSYSQRQEIHTPIPVQNVASKQPESNTFYMGSPIENFFPKNSRSNEYKKGLVLYKFFQTQNQNEAQFEFVSDEETIKHIRSNSMELVNPACNSQNSPSTNTNTVRTISKGFARFDNDRWNIIEKALIKFE